MGSGIKNGKPHGLPFVNFITWGSLAPKKKICVSSMRLTTGTRKPTQKLNFSYI